MAPSEPLFTPVEQIVIRLAIREGGRGKRARTAFGRLLRAIHWRLVGNGTPNAFPNRRTEQLRQFVNALLTRRGPDARDLRDFIEAGFGPGHQAALAKLAGTAA